MFAKYLSGGLAALTITLTLAGAAAAVPTIYTVGDSTVMNYSPGYYPQTGWGQVLGLYFDPARVAVVNKAVGGTSSKSFYDSYWPGVKSLIKPGDYVTIGFGINDALSDPTRHTEPFTTFKDTLRRLANETRALGAWPILVATQPRNVWTTGATPTVVAAYGNYPVASRQLATELGVPLIDLDRRGIALLQGLGQAYSTSYLYNYYLPGEYPNFPKGFADSIHFQHMGAHELANAVVAELRTLAGDANVGKLIGALKPTYPVSFTSNNPAGGQITRSEFFPAGASVTAYARPYAGYSFVSWNGDVTSSKRNTVFTMARVGRSLNATFSGSPASYQAEGAALLGAGMQIGSAYGGYTGSGYVIFPASGGTLSFNQANGGDGGARILRVRYALGGALSRTGQLVVNGTARAVTFAATGTYASWAVLEIAVTLAAGSNNTIQLKSTGAGLGNVDEMTVR